MKLPNVVIGAIVFTSVNLAKSSIYSHFTGSSKRLLVHGCLRFRQNDKDAIYKWASA
jgi:hypothetical protein